MPALTTRPNRTGAMRLAVDSAWSSNDDPAQRVAEVLKSFPGFTLTLRSALRRSRRQGNMLYLEGFGLFQDEAHVLLYLVECAVRDARSFYAVFRDVQMMIDARNRILRKTRR